MKIGFTLLKLPPKSLAKALEGVENYNNNGVKCSLSFLPVRKNEAELIQQDFSEYLKALDEIHARKLDCDITLKLHQFGIYGDYNVTKKFVGDIVTYAKKRQKYRNLPAGMPKKD